MKQPVTLSIDFELLDRFRKIAASKRFGMSEKIELWIRTYVRMQDGMYKPEDDGPILKICPNCKRNLRQRHLEESPVYCLYCEHPLEVRP